METAAAAAPLPREDMLARMYASDPAADGRFLTGVLTTGIYCLPSCRPATAAEQRLRAVRGIGPWSAQYVLMRGFGLADCVPVGDSALATALQRFFSLDRRPGPAETAALMEPFAPFRSLATFHLWQTLATTESR